MATLIIRNLDESLGAALKAEARKHATSVNKLVHGYIGQGLRQGTARDGAGAAAPAHDLGRFAGCWSKQQHAAFDRDLRHQRQIDPDLWQ
jgi:plasmid stability protein